MIFNILHATQLQFWLGERGSCRSGRENWQTLFAEEFKNTGSNLHSLQSMSQSLYNKQLQYIEELPPVLASSRTQSFPKSSWGRVSYKLNSINIHSASPACQHPPQSTILASYLYLLTLPLFINLYDPSGHTGTFQRRPHFSAIPGRQISSHFFLEVSCYILIYTICMTNKA